VAAVTVPKTFVCERCSAVLRSQRDLTNHLCIAHDDCAEARLGTPITYRCATCGKPFARRGDLHEHLLERGHGRPAEWGKARPQGSRRSRGRPPGGTG
jgi:uncharacterized C2H2 Zn-finger protein